MDNLSALMKIPENDGDFWRAEVLPLLLGLRRRNVAVILIHHSGKSGQQRGTSTREDSLDSVLKFYRADDQPHDGARFGVSFTKSRNSCGDDLEPFIAELKNDNGLFRWELSSNEQSLSKRLLDFIEAVDGATVSSAAKELGVNHGSISRVRKKLVADGLLRMKGKDMVFV